MPKGNPSKGFSLDSFGNKRAAALLRSREFQICIAFPMGQSSTGFGGTLFLACKHLLVCKMTDDYAAKQQIWGHLSAARHFCSAKILAGRAAMGDGGPHRRGGSPRAKKFPEEICFAPSRVLQICRTPDYRVLKSTRVRSTSTTIRIGQPGVSEGPRPSVSEGVQRKPFPRVSFGQFLRGGSTPRFFAQLRSVGSN